MTNIDMFVSDLRSKTTTEDWQAGGGLPDIVRELHRDRHLPARLVQAACHLVADMARCHGSSGGLVSSHGVRVDGGSGDRDLGPVADVDAWQRMSRVLSSLRPHERELLTWCIVSGELERGSLADWGRQLSAYSTPRTARAFAAGQIRSMLETVGAGYQL